VASVSVTIDGKSYRMACEDGQEARLRGLAADFDRRLSEQRKFMGEIGDMRLTVVAALMLSDELTEATRRANELEEELKRAQALNTAAAERSDAMQDAVAAALNSAAQRVETVMRSLTKGRADGLPIG
jgi:cell division protein ZapA